MWTHRIGRIGVLVATLVVTGVAGGCDALGPEDDTEVGGFLTIDTCCGRVLESEEQLAGIEIELSGIGRTRSFTAADFLDDNLEIPPIPVPDSGAAFVAVTLRQDGAIASEGSASWALEPRVRWRVAVHRQPFPIGAGVQEEHRHLPNPPCEWFWCQRVWRFEIREQVRNRPEEALWLTLYRHHPDQCLDLCSDE